ncbi:MAG: Tim44 domain-containing protein [Bacteroidales bacterium]|nr:Tim44 domain-containing protein [Bacteroidales bacterium]
MKKLNTNKLKQFLPFILLLLAIVCCNLAIADVGNNNRYSSGGGGFDGGDGDIGALIGYLIGLFIQDPSTGLIVLLIIVAIIIIRRRKQNKQSTDTTYINKNVNAEAESDITMDFSGIVAEQVRAIDPDFSSDKFIGFAREVFMKIQEAWTAKDWKIIRPFESENLFNQHKQQLDEYIRSGKTNVIEKIGIKHCSLHSFQQDGDKEVLTVWLNAIMRDYVIEDETKKVLESDPNRDWYMKYELVFNRKAGLKTEPGKKGNSITNCPNCGAPTEVTSSGQCTYCGSVITNGEHDWVLTDIHSRS